MGQLVRIESIEVSTRNPEYVGVHRMLSSPNPQQQIVLIIEACDQRVLLGDSSSVGYLTRALNQYQGRAALRAYRNRWRRCLSVKRSKALRLEDHWCSLCRRT